MEPTRAPRGLELEALVLAEKRSDVRARIVCGVGVAAVSLIGGLMASRASGSDTAGRAIAGTCSTFEVNVELQDPRTLAVHVCGVVLFVPTIRLRYDIVVRATPIGPLPLSHISSADGP